MWKASARLFRTKSSGHFLTGNDKNFFTKIVLLLMSTSRDLLYCIMSLSVPNLRCGNLLGHPSKLNCWGQNYYSVTLFTKI